MKKRLLTLALAALCAGLVLEVAPSALASNGQEQVVFTASASPNGQNASGSGTFTFGGQTNTNDPAFSFWIWCGGSSAQPYNADRSGSFYVYAFKLSQGASTHVTGTISETSPGIYTITLASPSTVAGCTLTNSGSQKTGTTQTVTVTCTGNGTTSLSGSGTATAVVNVTGS